jgi:hypothetical protein
MQPAEGEAALPETPGLRSAREPGIRRNKRLDRLLLVKE